MKVRFSKTLRGIPVAAKRFPGGLLRARRRHKDGLRSVELVVLAAALVVQLAVLGSHLSRYTPAVQTERSAAAALLPVRMAVRGEKGLYGAQYSMQVEADWSRTAALWRQALTNSKGFAPATQEDYCAVLSNPLLLAEFDGSAPMEALCSGLNTNAHADMQGLRIGGLTLVQEEGDYVLYVRSGADGTISRAKTAVNDTDFSGTVQQFAPNDCTMAADHAAAGVQGDTLEFSQAEQYPQVMFSAYSPTEEGNESLLAAFGIDADSAAATTKSDGTLRFAQNGARMLVSTAGALTYDGSCPVDGDEYAAMADICSRVLLAIDSEASASLTKTYQKDGKTVAIFSMRMNGIPVDNQATGYFARFELTGGAITHADMALRVCASAGALSYVMPEAQTIAALPAGGTAVLSLRYTDVAEGTDALWSEDDNLWESSNGQEGTTALPETPTSPAPVPNTGTEEAEAVSAAWHALYFGDVPETTLLPADLNETGGSAG